MSYRSESYRKRAIKGAEIRTVADCSHARSRERLRARAVVLYDGTSTAFYSQDSGNLQNDI